MKTKFLVRKVITKFIFLISSLTILRIASESPIITNEITLSQMENSNSAFIFMSYYVIVFKIIALVLFGLVVFSLTKDILKFIAQKEKEN